MVGGLSLTFGLCLAIARQFLDGAIPAAFGDALRVDGLSALVLVLCGFVGLLVGHLRRGLPAAQRGPRHRHAAHAPGVLRADPRLRVRDAPGRHVEQSRHHVDRRRVDDAGVGLSDHVPRPGHLARSGAGSS